MTTKQRISYIPIDRAIALINKEELAVSPEGTALFADISGFSTLTEMLHKQLGSKAGAEELIRHLNQAFDSLIGVVHHYGGSVISFSGDAISCWFDAERLDSLYDSACAALMSAQEMRLNLQKIAAIELPDGQVVQLQIKITLASGVVQRWVLGNPRIQLIDTILGTPINRLATAEKLANSGEIVADEAVMRLLKDDVEIGDIRYSHDKEAYSVIASSHVRARTAEWDDVSDDDLDDYILREWILPDVNAHLDVDVHDLTELRTAVALFMKFELVPDHDAPAEQRIKGFIRWAQGIIHQHGGNLLQITFGDKGSYLYAGFGAPLSHENNAFPALIAALYLREVPKELGTVVQMAVSTGMMRAGSYGSPERYTYGVQGDEVNIAARLMMQGESGEVLVSQYVREQVNDFFTFSEPVAITVKGQSEPIDTSRLFNRIYQTQSTVVMPVVSKSTIVGRATSWIELHRALKNRLTKKTKGLIYLCSEAGMGKTFLSTAVRKTIQTDYNALWLSAPCDTVLGVPLAPFKFLLLSLFKQDQTLFDREYQALCEFVAMESPLPDKERQALLESLENNRSLLNSWCLPDTGIAEISDDMLSDMEKLSHAICCLLGAYSLRQPLVLNIQDSQAIDSDSERLIEQLIQYEEPYSIVILLSSRFAENGQVRKIRTVPEDFDDHIMILGPLTDEESEQLIKDRLDGVASEVLKAHILHLTQGNPLYIRMLVQHLMEREYVHLQDGIWEITEQFDHNDLPFGLQTQITGQIDRLGPKLKSVIQAAAVIGRNFDIHILGAMLDIENISEHVSECEDMGIWKRLVESYYGFTSSLFRDVAYSLLGRERRIELHEAAHRVIPHFAPDTKATQDRVESHRLKAEELRNG